MSDDLERMLRPQRPERASAANPRLRVGPRLQGGQPLDGGPQLDLERSPVGPQATEPIGSGPTDTAPMDDAKEKSLSAGGPHLTIRRDEGHTPAESPQAVTTSHTARTTASTESPSVVTTTSEPRTEASDGQAEARDTGHQLVAIGLAKSYHKGPIEVPVLKEVNLGVHRGEFVAVIGESGSGKSTLLHLLGTLDAPDAGEIHFEGRRIDNLPSAGRDALRNKRFGMIFQFYHLLPEFSTLENVLAPLMIARGSLDYLRHRRHYRRIAAELLEMVGLGHRLKHKPRELSGGEMQRAAIARALMAGPDLLLADEPTGNLDQATGRGIMETLGTLNRQQNLTIVMVTHDQAIAQQAHRVVRLVEGRIEG